MSRKEITNAQIDNLLGSARFAPVPEDRVRQIEDTLAAGLKPVRPLAPPGVYFAAWAALFIAISLGSWRLMAGPLGWEALSGFERALIFVPLAVIAACLVFSLARQMIPAAAYQRSAAIIAAGVFLWLLVFMILSFRPMHESAFLQNAGGCFRIGMLFALPTGMLSALLLWRGAGLTPGLLGATAGGLAGLAGLTVLEIHCPNLNLYHILAAHASVVVVCTMLGFLVSSAIGRLRSS